MAVKSEHGGFAIVPIWVLQCGLSGAELAVYVALRSYADRQTGHAWPRVSEIAARAGVSKRTAERAIAEMREKGLLETEKRYREDGSIGGCEYWMRDTPTGTTDESDGTPTDRADGTPPTGMAVQEQTKRTDHMNRPRKVTARPSRRPPTSERVEQGMELVALFAEKEGHGWNS